MKPSKPLDALCEHVLTNARPFQGVGMGGPNFQGYTSVEYAKRLDFRVGKSYRTFVVLTYRMYNAFGLYGSEDNGIAVVDYDNREVVRRNIARTDSGWFGINQEQLKTFNEMCAMSYDEFIKFIERNGQ